MNLNGYKRDPSAPLATKGQNSHDDFLNNISPRSHPTYYPPSRPFRSSTTVAPLKKNINKRKVPENPQNRTYSGPPAKRPKISSHMAKRKVRSHVSKDT